MTEFVNFVCVIQVKHIRNQTAEEVTFITGVIFFSGKHVHFLIFDCTFSFHFLRTKKLAFYILFLPISFSFFFLKTWECLFLFSFLILTPLFLFLLFLSLSYIFPYILALLHLFSSFPIVSPVSMNFMFYSSYGSTFFSSYFPLLSFLLLFLFNNSSSHTTPLHLSLFSFFHPFSPFFLS